MRALGKENEELLQQIAQMTEIVNANKDTQKSIKASSEVTPKTNSSHVCGIVGGELATLFPPLDLAVSTCTPTCCTRASTPTL